jgi:thiaminase/transcriptional activator TenA
VVSPLHYERFDRMEGTDPFKLSLFYFPKKFRKEKKVSFTKKIRTLLLEKFRNYVLQDFYYLSHFAKVQALAAAKATDLYTTARFAAHAQGTYDAEHALHHKFSALLGITEKEQQQFNVSPTAYAYTSHLYHVANGRLGNILAAILPCYLLSYEIGERLKYAIPDEPI